MAKCRKYFVARRLICRQSWSRSRSMMDGRSTCGHLVYYFMPCLRGRFHSEARPKKNCTVKLYVANIGTRRGWCRGKRAIWCQKCWKLIQGEGSRRLIWYGSPGLNAKIYRWAYLKQPVACLGLIRPMVGPVLVRISGPRQRMARLTSIRETLPRPKALIGVLPCYMERLWTIWRP